MKTFCLSINEEAAPYYSQELVIIGRHFYHHPPNFAASCDKDSPVGISKFFIVTYLLLVVDIIKLFIWID